MTGTRTMARAAPPARPRPGGTASPGPGCAAPDRLLLGGRSGPVAGSGWTSGRVAALSGHLRPVAPADGLQAAGREALKPPRVFLPVALGAPGHSTCRTSGGGEGHRRRSVADGAGPAGVPAEPDEAAARTAGPVGRTRPGEDTGEWTACGRGRSGGSPRPVSGRCRQSGEERPGSWTPPTGEDTRSGSLRRAPRLEGPASGPACSGGVQPMRTPHMNGMPLVLIASYRTTAPGLGEWRICPLPA